LVRWARGAAVACLVLLLAAAPAAAQQGVDTEPDAPTSLLGADRESFADDFSVPGAWGVIDDESARVAYDDGALAITLKRDASGRSSTRRPAQASPAMRLELDVELGADGSSAGPMCGTVTGGPDFAFGVVNTGDDWFVGRSVDNVISLVASGHLDGMDVAIGTPVRLTIECASTDAGDRVLLWVDDQLVADVSGDEPRGPYDRVGVYADAATAGSVVRFDDAVASDAGPVPGLETLGATTQAWADDFSTPGAWGTLDDDASRIEYEDGALVVTLKEDGSGRWTGSRLPYASREMRLELDTVLGADGSSAGPMCFTADSAPEVTFGVIDNTRTWTIGRMVDSAPAIIARGQLAGAEVTPGTPIRMALECAVTDEGDRMALWIDGALVADVTSTQQHGPYDEVGVYADAVAGGTTVRFDDAVVLTGTAVSTLSSLGAGLVAVDDSFDDPTRWTTGRARQGRVSYADGALKIALRRSDSALWSWQTLMEDVPVVRAEGMIRLADGSGHAGFLCGAPGDDPPFYWAGLSSSSEVVLGSAASSKMTEIARAPLPAGFLPADSHRLALECAVTGDGADRVAVWVDGQPALDQVMNDSLGAFDRAAVYAHALARRFGTSFDDVVISAGGTYAPVGGP
jgi:hypothetical protein